MFYPGPLREFGSGHQLSARRTPSGWTRPALIQRRPTTIDTARWAFSVLRSQLAVHAPQDGMRKDLLAPQAAPSLSVFAIRRGGLHALVQGSASR